MAITLVPLSKKNLHDAQRIHAEVFDYGGSDYRALGHMARCAVFQLSLGMTFQKNTIFENASFSKLPYPVKTELTSLTEDMPRTLEDLAGVGMKSAKYFLICVGTVPVGIIGYCVHDETPENACDLAWFGLLRKYRGCGYGRAALTLTIAEAAKEFPLMYIWCTSLREEVAAFKLYGSVGFAIEEGEKREDSDVIDYIFSKRISQTVGNPSRRKKKNKI